MDQLFEVRGEDPDLPKPNLAFSGEEHDQDGYYLIRSTAILALVENAEAPEGRIDEANRYLRYMVHKWPARNAGDVGDSGDTILNS